MSPPPKLIQWGPNSSDRARPRSRAPDSNRRAKALCARPSVTGSPTLAADRASARWSAR